MTVAKLETLVGDIKKVVEKEKRTKVSFTTCRKMLLEVSKLVTQMRKLELETRKKMPTKKRKPKKTPEEKLDELVEKSKE